MNRMIWSAVGVSFAVAVAVAVAVASAPVGAQPSDDEIIQRALSAAPPQLREGAAVVGLDGTVLREGSNGFTCMLTPVGETGGAPMCVDAAWGPWAEAWVNQSESFTPSPNLGIAYMLAGDASAGDAPTGGASNIDPFATEPTADNQWVVEGPHVMLIAPDPALLAGIPSDPNTGGPYVMWRDTPYAHVMLPVGERPEQPEVAEQ